jgi:hypothetical protein
MDFSWFKVVAISRMPPPYADENIDSLEDWAKMSLSLIADLDINLATEYQIRVDALPLLYEILNSVWRLERMKGFEIAVGESWWFTGSYSANDMLKLKIEFVAGGIREGMQ